MEIYDLFIIGIGIVLLVSPLFTNKEISKMKRRTERTLGLVIGHDEQRMITSFNSSRINTDHAVIAFKAYGKTFKFVSNYGASWIIHPKGSRVIVCYNPADPRNADVETPGWYHFLMLIMQYGFPLAGIIILIFKLVG